MTESDQEIYKDFNLTVSERWQQEIAGISRAIVSPKIENFHVNFLYSAAEFSIVIIPACGLNVA